MKPKFDEYVPLITLDNGEWRWEIVFKNETIGASHKGFPTEKECIDNMLQVKDWIQDFQKRGHLKVTSS